MAGQTQLSHKMGSDNQIFRHDIPAKVKRSSFPYGRKRDFCIDPGPIVPIDLWETLPGDYFEVDLDYILKSFPLKVPPFTSYKVRTHWYYTKKNWLWKGALTYMTKGRSHSISLSNPVINVHSSFAIFDSHSQYADLPMSLSSYLGFQPGHIKKAANIAESCDSTALDDTVDTVSGVNDLYGGVNALPFFFYQKIYRFGYIKPNLLQDNKIWFPDDMSDGWRINYDKSNLVASSSLASGPLCFFTANGPTTVTSEADVPSVIDTGVNILRLRYAMFEDDRFTTALPWSTRGQAPSVDVTGDAVVKAGDLTLTVPAQTIVAHNTLLTEGQVYVKEAPDYQQDMVYAQNGYVKSVSTTNNVSGSLYTLAVASSDILSPSQNISNGSNIPVSVLSLGFDINDLRAKIALTVWQERNARTEGWYNDMIYQHFQENPDSEDFEPIYLGGTSDVISFSEVIQHDNSSSDVTAQGHAAGLGETRAGGHVFSFRSKDYGYIMGVMIIQPETVYNSKVEKLWLRKVQEDEYFPEYQGLGLQEILKGEIYPTGTTSDIALFGYQERDTEYKTRDNQAIGFFALPHTLDRLMSAYSQCREFNGQPSLSQQFVTMSPSNMRKDCLAVPSMPFFRCSLATRIHAVRPMAYKNTPNTFGF